MFLLASSNVGSNDRDDSRDALTGFYFKHQSCNIAHRVHGNWFIYASVFSIYSRLTYGTLVLHFQCFLFTLPKEL